MLRACHVFAQRPPSVLTERGRRAFCVHCAFTPGSVCVNVAFTMCSLWSFRKWATLNAACTQRKRKVHANEIKGLHCTVLWKKLYQFWNWLSDEQGASESRPEMAWCVNAETFVQQLEQRCSEPSEGEQDFTRTCLQEDNYNSRDETRLLPRLSFSMLQWSGMNKLLLLLTIIHPRWRLAKMSISCWWVAIFGFCLPLASHKMSKEYYCHTLLLIVIEKLRLRQLTLLRACRYKKNPGAPSWFKLLI